MSFGPCEVAPVVTMYGDRGGLKFNAQFGQSMNVTVIYVDRVCFMIKWYCDGHLFKHPVCVLRLY